MAFDSLIRTSRKESEKDYREQCPGPIRVLPALNWVMPYFMKRYKELDWNRWCDRNLEHPDDITVEFSVSEARILNSATCLGG